MTDKNWFERQVPPDRIELSEDAEAWVVDTFRGMSEDPSLLGHVRSLTYALGGARYSAAGELESEYGPHVVLGTYLRADVPEEIIVEFLGFDAVLLLNPFFESEQKINIKKVKLRTDGRRLLADFDPPAPEPPKIHRPQHRTFQDLPNSSEGNTQ